MDENTQGVIPESPTGEAVAPQEPVVQKVVEAIEPQNPPKGYVPYQALDEERTKRKQLEAELERLNSTPIVEQEVFSDEGKLLQDEIRKVKEEASSKIGSLEKQLIMKDLQSAYPVLKDKADEFENFVADPENKGMNLKTAAKAFLTERNLLDSEPIRKGLEKPTGGGQNIPDSETYTAEQVKDLMKNDYNKYEALVRAGKIK